MELSEEARVIMIDRIAREECDEFDTDCFLKHLDKLNELSDEKLVRKYNKLYNQGCQEKWEFEDAEALKAKY